ncbi:DNA ligase 1 [Scheffersomyces spartinae]|uniref:DNA ligase n=1 Tax=Scheffersomyces spartinae TaxID=45513 RepID=A0A9P8ALP2_9ASCO|nr:DNA ligase 1 [Scheffersomyces spartinae]KAG7196294.1 DNA ligase 1 [Scheffersomyces spartinae]
MLLVKRVAPFRIHHPFYFMAQQQNILRFFGGGKPVPAPKRKLSDQSPVETRPPPSSSPSSPIKSSKKLKINPDNASATALEDDASSLKDSDLSEGEVSTKDNLKEADVLIKLTEKVKAEHATEKLVNEGAALAYSKVSNVFERVESESSRLAITAIVSEFFLEVLQQSTVDMLVKVVYLFINRLGPDYEPDLELGLGETLLIKTISECYGRPLSKIRADYKETGDLGIVAQKSRSGQPTMFRPARLDVEGVFNTLTSIAKTNGKDSQTKKINLINRMLTACDPKTSEAKFLIRSLEGKLRIGLAEKTIQIAIAQAFVNFESDCKSESKSLKKKINPQTLTKAEDIVREAFSQVPNYEMLIHNAYDHGVMNLLEHSQLTPGVPLKPMLAKPTKSITEVLDRFQGEEFTCEYKYDGERAQVHLLPNGEVRIYSRNSEDMSQRYPDLISIVQAGVFGSQNRKVTSMIMDCEAVAYDRKNDKILPFQVLSTRKRKSVDENDITVQICLFAFDLLYFNEESLITKSLAERRKVLFDNFTPVEGKFRFATQKNSSNLDELQQFLDQSVKDSCEGLMVKMLNGSDSFYEPSKRSRNWLKLKKDYLAGVGDSLDLVVIGGYTGRGKRTGAYGGFLLASYNQDTGEYETACKVGTGFKDEDLSNLYQKLHHTEILQPKTYYVYDTTNSNAVPDVWFEPTMLFEVLTADLSLSPIYKAAHLEYGKGISLRFPRFIRIRDDKGIEDATSSTEIAEFYERQANVN